jgi:UDP:flavonoid glycosyltransferase YjiC (YdhE family)
MRVLFTCIPASGHFHPLVPIAAALRAAGHDVRFASAPPLAAQVAAAGFAFFPAGDDARALALALPEHDTLSPLARREVFRRRLFPAIWPAARLPALRALAAAWPPDLVVSDNYEFAGRVAAEHRGVPHAAVQVAPVFGYADRLALVPAMDALRASVGLPPDPDAAMLFRYLYLLCEAPQFRPDEEVLPPTAHRLRRAPFDQSGDERLPAWVAALPDRPTVFATLGTSPIRPPGVLAAILAGLRDEPLTLALTTGRDLDPATFGPQPEHVHVERYIPQSLLFPCCDLVVSHCGSGTLYAALDHGLPLVNIPIAADQPENAARCAALGVGVTVGPDERTPEAIRAAMREVLANPAYRANAARLRDAMAALPGPEHAVALLERLAAEQQPLLTA